MKKLCTCRYRSPPPPSHPCAPPLLSAQKFLAPVIKHPAAQQVLVSFLADVSKLVPGEGGRRREGREAGRRNERLLGALKTTFLFRWSFAVQNCRPHLLPPFPPFPSLRPFQDWVWEPRAHDVLSRFRSTLLQQTAQGSSPPSFPPPLPFSPFIRSFRACSMSPPSDPPSFVYHTLPPPHSSSFLPPSLPPPFQRKKSAWPAASSTRCT